jgi:hypothetical protein
MKAVDPFGKLRARSQQSTVNSPKQRKGEPTPFAFYLAARVCLANSVRNSCSFSATNLL